jgi:hypothetical protein
MAKNLRQKVPKEDTLYIHDVNSAVLAQFQKELSDYKVQISQSAREVAELSVSVPSKVVATSYVAVTSLC